MKNNNMDKIICYNLNRRGKNGKSFMEYNYTALDFAYWFLWYNQVEQIKKTIDEDDLYEGLSHLKVQKLLYYADGICLAVNDLPLFKEKVYAWQHGPVVREVYEELSINGRDEIPFNEKFLSIIESINNNDELYNILITTYENYAGYTAWQLREKTHVPGSPWQITVDSTGLQTEINIELIKKYFKENIVTINE